MQDNTCMCTGFAYNFPDLRAW